MSTRALIGYLNRNKLTITYNHYDGYPESLGKGLETFYNTPDKAEEIANAGYISYLDKDTGEWNAANKQTAGTVEADMWENFMEEIAGQIDDYSADYAYIYDPSQQKWITIKNNGINGMIEDLTSALISHKSDFKTLPESTMKINEITNEELEKAIASMLEYLSKDQVLDYVKKIIDYLDDEKVNESTKKQWQYKAGIIK